MSIIDLQGSCDWSMKSCDQLLLPPSTGAEERMEDVVGSHSCGERSDVLPSSCLPAEEASEMVDVSLVPAEQVVFDVADVQNAAHACKAMGILLDASQLPLDCCPQLVDCGSSELPISFSRNLGMISVDPTACGKDSASYQDRKDGLCCPICQSKFRSPSELKEHFKSHPPPPQDFRCWQGGCLFTAQDVKRFQSHLKREHKLTPVTCSHRSCRLVFPNREEMSRHYRYHFPFHCHQCDFVSSNTKLFSQHQKSHARDEGPRHDFHQKPSSPARSTAGDIPGDNSSQFSEGVNRGSTPAVRPRKRRRPLSGTEEEAGRGTSGGDEGNEHNSVIQKTARMQNSQPARNKSLRGDLQNGQEYLFKTHMCPECKRCFKKRTHLADHLHLHFPDPNLQCPNCRKFFTSRSKLKIHMMRESGEKTHRCPLCDYSSVEKNALNRHMASIHEGVSNLYSDTYSCPVCHQTFKLSQALKDHMKGHKPEQTLHFCFEAGCSQASSDRKEFLRHLKESHGIQAVECRYHACSLLFRNREEMEEHRKKHYAFHCQECDFVCSNKHVFRKHKKRGHPGSEELACGFCPYKSFNPVEYADHMGKMHAYEKIHRCGDCDFATSHKRVLIRHRLLHTGEKPHKCSQCDFVCRDLSYLSKHMLTHSTDKNYMCTECGYITKWKHYLNVHMRKHRGDLRYHCNQCSYRCHRADQLSSHKLRHQGKSLICEICGFGCKRKSELQKHVQVKHLQSTQTSLYQCQFCNYQTKHKQTLRNHENGKHTKHREFRCALCSFRTFSNTSLFFHKRKSHGYVPGDKAWLERYASKQREINQTDLLFPYKTELSFTLKQPSEDKATLEQNCEELVDHMQDDQANQCLNVESFTDPPGDANMSVAEESLLAAITLEPVETCSIEMEDFPVRLELSTSSELMAKEPAVETGEETLPVRGEILCFSETLTVEEHMTCGQDYEEEADGQTEDLDKLDNTICVPTVQYSAEPVLCEITNRCEELPVHLNGSLQIQTGDISVEVQESWADVVKNGVQLTIVCESAGLDENHVQQEEPPAVSVDEACDNTRPESILKALRKQDKEQAETLVLEGRVQMLVVQSKSKVYRCEKCSFITKKKACMVHHGKNGCSMRKSTLTCTECGASFKQQRGLNTHLLKKCPVILKKKKTGRKETVVSISIDEHHKIHPKDDQANTVSPEEVMLAPQEAILPQNCLEASSPLSPSRVADHEPFKEIISEGSTIMEHIGKDLNSNTQKEPESAGSGIVPQRYRLKEGKFRCLFCSYSCSRECTISCHVNENCREIKRLQGTLGPPVGPRSETALKDDQCVENGGIKNSRRKEPDPEILRKEDGHNGDEEETNGESSRSMVEATSISKLSCPNCPFTCSQERAMRTHKKKGCLKPGELQCPLCSYRCMSTSALKRHGDLHQKYSQSRGQLQCKLCDFTCKQPRCLKQHVRIRHEGVKPHRCKYCDFSTTRRYRLEAHESLHTGVGRISCGACNRTFGTNSKLRLHQRRVHDKKPTHFCSLCDYSGYSQNDIDRHLSSCHTGEPDFPCSVCQARFSSDAALKQHVLRKHQEKATYECSLCPFSCHSQATLRCHGQKHHLQLECVICKETFTRRQDLEEHRKSHFAHHCQQCQYAAKDRQQLVNHYAEVHETSALPGAEGEKGSLHCPFCAFSCNHQLVYDHHVKGHGATRLYKCSDCNYSTRNKQKITWHSRIHTGEKPYKCHLCTYACGDPSRLKYHMRIHRDEKKYLCPECGYKCKWVNQLKYHMTKHTGLKPYQCEECDYCTNRADALRVHRETRHREVRSFICEQCGKAFKTRFLLKTHLKKHSEDKPYVCNVCQRGFRWPAGLRHHYLTHTNQQPFFCQHCPYRAKQKFQVVKHLQRHHPSQPDVEKGVGKEPYLFSVQGHSSVYQQAPECEGDAASETAS
ncbi:zinc finger protein 142 [Hyperolius riggenbachi]|uniref:zinc finger protein 142 n=1 Tax=Hyperolius riggenbachi TaxID=752182 RepID=UPI0035A371A5